MISNVIIGITLVVSIIAFENRDLFYRLSWNPYSVKAKNQWYRAITHGFIHVDIPHLAMNMYVLYIFGGYLEHNYNLIFDAKGNFYYVLLYLGGMFFALPSSYKRHQLNYGYNSAGASGAISAVVFSSILIEPVEAKIGLLFIPIYIPAFIFGILYLILEVVLDKRGRDNVAHDAHFWGAVFGFFFAGLLKPELFGDFINKVYLYLF